MKNQEKKQERNQTQIGCSYTIEVPMNVAVIGKLASYKDNDTRRKEADETPYQHQQVCKKQTTRRQPKNDYKSNV